jgi:hypothetical protein
VKIADDPRRTVGAVACLEEGADLREQSRVGLAAGTRTPVEPFMETARGPFDDPTQRSRRPDAALPNDEGVPHVGSLAK